MAAPVPFSEPPYLCGLPSPYYTPELRKWQKACKAFIGEHLTPFAMEWEAEETVPEHLFEVFSKHHMLIPALPAPLPAKELKACGIHDILGVVKVEDFTYFHNLIYNDEMARSGLAGPGFVSSDMFRESHANVFQWKHHNWNGFRCSMFDQICQQRA